MEDQATLEALSSLSESDLEGFGAAPSLEDLPMVATIEIIGGVSPESVARTLKALKSQIDYHWDSLFEYEKEDPPEVNLEIVGQNMESIEVRISLA